MNQVLEIRHSPREIRNRVLLYLCAGALFELMHWFTEDWSPSSRLFWVVYWLVIAFGAWLWMRQKYLAADDSGVTYTNRFVTRRISWREVAFYSIEPRSQTYLYAASSGNATNQVIVFLNAKREVLLRITLNFGSPAECVAFGKLVAEKLEGSAIQIEIEC